MIVKKRDFYLAILLMIAMITTVVFYTLKKYVLIETEVSSIEIVLNKDANDKAIPIMYFSGEHEDNIDFKNPNHFAKVSDSTYLTLMNGLKPRRIRLYLNNPQQSIKLYSIKVISSEGAHIIKLDDIDKYENLIFKREDSNYRIEVQSTNSFIELPQEITYTSDFERFPIYALLLLALTILAFFVMRLFTFNELKVETVSKITLGILILSVFCPAPIYNIALTLAVILNLKKLRHIDFMGQKMSLIFIAFFLIYLINNLFISEDSYKDMSTIDRLLPFLILSLIVPVINNRKLLIFFPISALILGFGFLATSLLDAFIYKNEVFLSFDFFTKYLHPIYYSYLLFFSICYVNLNMKGFKKYFLIGIFFVFMVFSGSKMVLIFTLVAMFIHIVKINNTGLLAIPLLLILVIFSPLKQRFNDILKIEDTSILKENHIDNPYDARINGLTLRLILWREALSTMGGVDYLIGKGVTDGAENELSSNLNKIGLTKHVNFNPHNQYVTTFWKTGALGLLFLMLIPISGIFYGIKNKDTLLIQFSVFMIAVMFSESIFGRVNGIYFFTIVLLMLTNSKPNNENSDYRN